MKKSFAKALAVATAARGADEPGPRDELALRFYVTAATLSVVVMATAVAALAGWAFEIPALKSVFPGFVTMKPNAAVGLALTAIVLWIYRDSSPSDLAINVQKYCAIAAVALASLTLFQYATGWSIGIDQVLFNDLDPDGGPPGRMALATAVSLILLNGSMFLGTQPGRYGWVQALAGSAILVATLNAVGYFFGLDTFAGIASYKAMAVHTAVSVLLLAFGILFSRPDEGLMNVVIDVGAGGLAIRQLLPVVFVLPVLLAWLSWQGVRIGWYEPTFAMTLFVALAANALSYAVWAGGGVLRAFDEERRQAEDERARSEERLRRAVIEAPVPIVIHDRAGRVLHMSRGWSLFSGYTLADTPTLPAWIGAAKPAGASPIDAYFDRAASAADAIQGGEWEITTRTGDQRTWDFSTTPLGTPGSVDHALVTMAVDITDRKRAEADLRRMNESLEQRITERTAELTEANDSLRRQSDQLQEQATLLDLVRDGILVRDLYGTIIYWSAGAAEMYGWSRDEALGKVSHRLVRTDYPKPIADIEKQVTTDGYWEGEIVQTTKHGTRLAVESRWTLTRTDRGKPQGFLEVNRDITSRKRAEEAVRDSERRFRSVAETALEGIISMDDRGLINYWNPGAERLFDRPAANAVGQPVSTVLPDRTLAALDASTGDTVGSTFETTGLRPDGATVPIELSLSSWSTSQGARIFTGIARDITERKNAERALETKAAELSRSNQELEQFAYVASHDLQEPLRMVSNYTQLLGRRYKDKLDADANEFIDFAVDGAKRMQDLIHDLLEYARVGTRGKEFKPTPLDKIVEGALANLSGAIEEAEAAVTVGTLPTLACDGSQLTQVFQNLIGNAIKFRRPGDRPAIDVSATRERDGWAISIKDNGIGIDPKYFERIFQMFQRLHGRGEYSGTGIGLALCKKIVERHGGRMQVASEPGAGTTFSFTMPDKPPAT